MSTVIRQAVVADLSQVHRIESESYPDPWPRSVFHLVFGRSPDLFLVAEKEGAVVGYTVGEVEEQDGLLVGHVMNLAVEVDQRRRGIGEMLLDELERMFGVNGAEAVYLEVRVGNGEAQSLYTRKGYAIKGFLRRYYRTEDGFRMDKHLKR